MANNKNDVELTLGLSSNGRFGVDPTRRNNNLLISQSSSVANLEMMGGGKKEIKEVSNSNVRLTKTCSLPSDYYKKKRKELQTKRRMDAKKKRWEKVIISQFPSGSSLINYSDENEGEKFPFTKAGELPRGDCVRRIGGSEIFDPSKILGTKMARGHSLPPEVDEIPKHTSKSGGVVDNEMPCVTTTGPDGNMTRGLLYKYEKGEEVKIVCICHGSFLSPAEFVKHAGCDNVSNPLGEIIVTNSSSN